LLYLFFEECSSRLRPLLLNVPKPKGEVSGIMADQMAYATEQTAIYVVYGRISAGGPSVAGQNQWTLPVSNVPMKVKRNK